MITIEMDRKNGLAYIYLPNHTKGEGSVKRTQTITTEMNYDYDEKDELIGIELLHVSKLVLLEKKP